MATSCKLVKYKTSLGYIKMHLKFYSITLTKSYDVKFLNENRMIFYYLLIYINEKS